MAGAFAHMCLVDELSRSTDLFSEAGQVGKVISFAIEENLEFCELGAVSPDLPYLDVFHSNSKGWANVMHYWDTTDIIRAGVSYFSAKNFQIKDDDILRSLAWLFGYAAHVATDLTVHPVLAASGYPYATNPSGHRYCELQQDAYIFRKLKGLDACDAKFIENCGIGDCGDPNDSDKVHPAIRDLWLHCLLDIVPVDVHIKNGCPGPVSNPTPDAWFHAYSKRVTEFVEQGGGFTLFLRDIVETEGVCLPKSGKVESKYIIDLKKHTGEPTNYDDVFAWAQVNVSATWKQLANAIAGKNQTLFALENANLDTGEIDANGKQVFVS